MLRDEILAIPAVGLLTLLLLMALREPLYSVLFKLAVVLFLVPIIAYMIWFYFTPSGRSFARTVDSRVQEAKALETQLSVQCQSLVNSISYGHLMNRIQRISTFTEVAEWDKEAEAAITEILKAIEVLDEVVDTVVSQHSNVSNLTPLRFKQKYQAILEDIATKLQEAIDFTPKSPKEQKALIRELTLAKKDLQLQKKQITLTMRNVNEISRSKSVHAGSFLGMYNSKIAAGERRKIRYQRDAQLRPNEAQKAALERQILQIEKDILSIKRFH